MSREPLVLIHGAGGTPRQWSPVVPLLTDAYDVHVPTLVGHWGGRPTPPGPRTSIDVLVDGVEADMDVAGLGTAHVAGTSLGSWVALELALLGTVLPSLAASAAGRIASPQPDERHRMLRTLRAMLCNLAEEGPLVVALDDLHWADSASVDLVCHSLHLGLEGPVLLMLASRPAQSESRLLTTLEEAERHDLARRIELTPLSVTEAGKLLREGIEPSLRDALYHESGGNPFYLEQLAAGAQRGSLPLSVEEGIGTDVPAAVSAVIRGEIDALSPLAKSVARAAALVAEPFEADLVADAAELKESAILGAFDELLDRDLIRPGGSPSGFCFRHPIVRRAVYETAGAGWRLAAHGRVAAALEARGASSAMRAHHIEQSGRTGDDAAIEVLTRAGQEAASRAPASAARWFGAALRLIPAGSDQLERRLALEAQRAAALGLAGRMEESREALRSFLQLSPPAPTPLRLGATVLAAVLDELLGRPEEGRRLLLDELATLSDQGSLEAAELKRELAFTCYMDGDWAGVEKWARASLDADCRGLVRVGALSALALSEHGSGNVDGARRWVSEAADLFDRMSDDEMAAHQPGIAIWLGWAEVCIERFDEAIRHLRRGTAVSRAVGQRHLTVGLLAVEGLALASEGRTRELAEVADSAIEAALLSESSLFLSWAMIVKCALETCRGDLYAAMRFGEQAMSAGQVTGSPFSEIARVQLAEVLVEIGEPERCRELLVGPDGRPHLTPFPQYDSLCYELLTRADVMLGHPDRAEEHVGRAAEVAGRLGLRIALARARRAQAIVSLEQGEARKAVAQALAAVSVTDEEGAAIEAARSRILAGKALAAVSERDRAIGELERAHEQLSRCGAFRYGDEAARELRKLGCYVRHVGEGADDSPVAGLTGREREVMELVAAGKTNREIANELYLSVRTVDRHASRIFEKLGVRSRAAAASQFERARADQPPHPWQR